MSAPPPRALRTAALGLALAGLLLATGGCSGKPPAPPSCEAGSPALQDVHEVNGPPPEAWFANEGSAISSGSDVPSPCARLGPDCSAPLMRLARAAALQLPATDCSALGDELVRLSDLDRSSAVHATTYATGSDWSAGELRSELIARLRLDRFPDPGVRHPLTVQTVDHREVPGGRRLDLLVHDPVLGAFRGVLLLPEGDGPHPAILGLLGHQQPPEQFLDEHGGQALFRAGYAVFVPVLRAYALGRLGRPADAIAAGRRAAELGQEGAEELVRALKAGGQPGRLELR